MKEHELGRVAWILYWGYWILTLIAAIPLLSWLGILGYIALVVVALMKIGEAADTIYESHFRNYVLVAVVGVVGSLVFVFLLVVSIDVGLSVGIIIIVGVLAWSVYRIVKGMLRLNSGRSYSD